jgi:hypothetical protein
VKPTKRPSAQRKSAQVVVAMMGMDNITCPSEGPVAGCAVGVPASARMRDLGPHLAAACFELRSGIQIAWVARQRLGTAECGSSTARGNAVCGRTACTVWEGAGGNAPMMPSPIWIAGWHIGGAPLAYLIPRRALRVPQDARPVREHRSSGGAGRPWSRGRGSPWRSQQRP